MSSKHFSVLKDKLFAHFDPNVQKVTFKKIGQMILQVCQGLDEFLIKHSESCKFGFSLIFALSLFYLHFFKSETRKGIIEAALFWEWHRVYKTRKIPTLENPIHFVWWHSMVAGGGLCTTVSLSDNNKQIFNNRGTYASQKNSQKLWKAIENELKIHGTIDKKMGSGRICFFHRRRKL